MFGIKFVLISKTKLDALKARIVELEKNQKKPPIRELAKKSFGKDPPKPELSEYDILMNSITVRL